MDRDKVTELLKNYRYYKMAVSQYDTVDEFSYSVVDPYMTAAPCRTTAFSESPIGRGSGSRAPTLTGDWRLDDVMEYRQFKYAVKRVDTALHLLSDDERSVITLKWMDGLTLEQVGSRKNYSREWAKKVHKRALEKLSICFRFDDVPQVEKITVA